MSNPERMEDALHSILDWAEAYPETVFVKPDLDRANSVLAMAGISMDAMHGTWARHLLEGVRRYAAEGLS